MKKPVYAVIAGKLLAIENCKKSNNEEWQEKHYDFLHSIIKEHLPVGGGFDCGTGIDYASSNNKQIVLTTEFHHMDEHGSYDGWTCHKITVKPDLFFGFTLTISGKNKNGIKEYLHDVFNGALATEIEEY